MSPTGACGATSRIHRNTVGNELSPWKIVVVGPMALVVCERSRIEQSLRLLAPSSCLLPSSVRAQRQPA